MPAAPEVHRNSLLVMVGDLSADRHTAKVIAKLKEISPDLRLWGVGGPEMQSQGFERLYNCEDFAVIGIFEVLRQIPFFAKLRSDIIEQIAAREPNAVLLVDFGGFNIGFSSLVHKRFPQLPLLYFISPQVWASRPWRMNEIARTVKKMLVIFPFEEELYRCKGIDARFVGHPLTANTPAPHSLPTREQFCAALGLEPSRSIVGVFPGSRNKEINQLLPVALNAMDQMLAVRSDLQFVISQGNNLLAERIRIQIAKHRFSGNAAPHVHTIDSSRNYDLMANADVIWAKSGTTTLEVTLFGTPMIIFYRAMWLTYLIFLIFIQIKRVGWPNLLAGEYLVPELIQLDCRAELLVRYTCDLLDVPGLRREIRERLLALRSQLGQGDYATNCAEEILEIIERSQCAAKQFQANV